MENFGFGFLYNPWLKFYNEWLNSFSEQDDPMRRFIRHPSDIPIAYSLDEAPSHCRHLRDVSCRDVSCGGLCFTSETRMETGKNIHIKISVDASPFEADGTVAWCRRESDAYAVGVEFTDNSTQYGVRMVEQICYIEHYRYEMLAAEGRELSSEEAAQEWVKKYAANFPA